MTLRRSSLVLGLWLAAPALVHAVQGPDAQLQAGIRQVNEGDLEGALITLDAVIQRLLPATAAHAADLSQAHLYKGVALVGLLQEEPAKASFREALRHAPELRLRTGQFPDRVVRVFEAARTGKEDSVMQRPSGTAKKAGLGAGAIVAIVGGIAVAGGAAAAVSGGGGPTPSPTPEPTPEPSRQVVPTSRLGPIDITFLSADPSPGSTISGCGAGTAGCRGRLRARFSVRSPLSAAGLFLSVSLRAAGRTCLAGRQGGAGGPQNFDLVAGEPFVIEIAFNDERVAGCDTPVTFDEMVAGMNRGTSGLPSDSEQRWSLTYRLVP